MIYNKFITATVYVINQGRVLLHQHKKYKTWFPLGGHIEADEFPHEAAVREVKEESGFDIELIDTEIAPDIELSRVKRIPTPFCLLHEGIDSSENFFDFIFIAETKEELPHPSKGESKEFKWFSYEELVEAEIKTHVKNTALAALEFYLRKKREKMNDMFERTHILQKLFDTYKISELEIGKKKDKLGDVFEDYCVHVLSSEDVLRKVVEGYYDASNLDLLLFKHFLSCAKIENIEYISKIEATKNVKHRATGGNPKTDVLVTIHYQDGNIVKIPISVKQTEKKKVSMAEFDVDTIAKEVGITDEQLKLLMKKHQDAGSAKGLTSAEQDKLKKLIVPYKRKLVRWVVSGTALPVADTRFPQILVKFKMKDVELVESCTVYTVDQYVDVIMRTGAKKPPRAGFGTGLSWTRASGSGTTKIQFKG